MTARPDVDALALKAEDDLHLGTGYYRHADVLSLVGRVRELEAALGLACADLAGTPVEAERLRHGYERAARAPSAPRETA